VSKVEVSQRDRWHRDPHWRVNLATRMADGQSVSRRAKMRDPLVARLATYLRAESVMLQSGYTDVDADLVLMERFPDIARPMEFWRNRNNLSGISLQAYLLTELTIEEVAQEFGLTTGEVTVFSDLCFDVRDRLENIQYISTHVLGPVFQSGLDSLNPALLARYFGYFGGAKVLHQVVHGLSRSIPLQTDDEVLGYLEAATRRNITTQAAIFATIHQPTRFDARGILEGYTAIRSAEKGDSGPKEQRWIDEVVTAMKSFQSVARSDERSMAYIEQTGLDVAQYRFEPRASEKQDVIDGKVSASAVIEQFPEIHLGGEVLNRS